MAGKEVGISQDQAGRNSHLILNLNFFFKFSRLLDFGLKSASQCQTLSPPTPLLLLLLSRFSHVQLCATP